jgi:hypothetical protein
MAMNPMLVANLMAQAAQQKAQETPSAGNPKAKRVAAAKEQEKAKGKTPPKKKPMPPQGGAGAPPAGGMPTPGM